MKVHLKKFIWQNFKEMPISKREVYLSLKHHQIKMCLLALGRVACPIPVASLLSWVHWVQSRLRQEKRRGLCVSASTWQEFLLFPCLSEKQLAPSWGSLESFWMRCLYRKHNVNTSVSEHSVASALKEKMHHPVTLTYQCHMKCWLPW